MAICEKPTAQFISLDPMPLLKEIPLARQTLSAIAAQGGGEVAPAGTPGIADLNASLASASKGAEAPVS